MFRIAVLGEQARTGGFALAGALVLTAEDPDQVRDAWAALPDDVAVTVLTPAAAAALAEEVDACRWPLLVVMPPWQ